MKKGVIILLITLSLLSVLGILFLVLGSGYGATVPEDQNFIQKVLSDSNRLEIETSDVTTTEDAAEQSTPSSSSGGGGGGSSSSGSTGESSSSSSAELTCYEEYIQYSLKQFVEEIECVENSTGTCTKLYADCSFMLHNIDVNSTDNFSLRYSLINSQEIEINFEEIDTNVASNLPQQIRAEFLIEDVNLIDLGSKCTIQILEVPKKEVCY